MISRPFCNSASGVRRAFSGSESRNRKLDGSSISPLIRASVTRT